MRNKPHLNIGTIGHVDHGKTTLTAAITKVWLTQVFLRRVASIQSTQLQKKKSVVSRSTRLTLSTRRQTVTTHVDCLVTPTTLKTW